jgi:hypothetical protein
MMRAIGPRLARSLGPLMVRAMFLAPLGCAAASWPGVKLPAGVTAFEVGEQVSVNGTPMRLQGFVTRTAPLETADWFRRSLGQPLVESQLPGKLVLGRAEGDYYVSVLLEPLPGEHGDTRGTRGTITVSNLKSAYDKREGTRALTERMLARLPTGSSLLNQLSSTERGRATSYVLAQNGHSQQLNRDHLVRRLAAEGYQLEHEALPDAKQARAVPAQVASGRTLFFKGKDKEAMVVIRPAQETGSTIALQTINIVKELK